jgi:hypothetical protein
MEYNPRYTDHTARMFMNIKECVRCFESGDCNVADVTVYDNRYNIIKEYKQLPIEDIDESEDSTIYTIKFADLVFTHNSKTTFSKVIEIASKVEYGTHIGNRVMISCHYYNPMLSSDMDDVILTHEQEREYYDLVAKNIVILNEISEKELQLKRIEDEYRKLLDESKTILNRQVKVTNQYTRILVKDRTPDQKKEILDSRAATNRIRVRMAAKKDQMFKLSDAINRIRRSLRG